MLVYSLISLLILITVSKFSYAYNLVDQPNERKKHPKPTAYTGGLALSFIYVISIYLFNIIGQELNLILSVGLLIAIVGFIDDKYQLNTGSKLSLQIFPIFYLVIIENLSLIHIGEYNFFKLNLNTFSMPFSVICVMFLINSFNYFDGLDGTLGFTTISTLGILYFLATDENTKLFLITILIPLLFFLFFNFSMLGLPKLFLGDGGSLLLGFIISFTLIFLANQNIVHPILLAWTISIFIFEFLSLNLARLKNRKNLFKAGLDHLHHILLKKNNSIFLTNLYICLLNIIFFIIGYLSFLFISPLASLALFVILFVVFFFFRTTYLV